jgi:hypothetical protein
MHFGRHTRSAAVALVILLAPGSALAQKLPGGTVPPPAKPRATTPRRPSKPTLALLIVLTSPQAEISLDGRVAGRADAEGQFLREMAPGTYRLTVSGGDDVEPFAREVVLKARTREVVDATLRSRFGTLILSLPRLEGSLVSLDAKPVARIVASSTGVTVEPVAGATGDRPIAADADAAQKTLTLSRLAPGTHSVRFENAEYETVEQTVVVAAGENRLVSFRPATLGGELELVTVPGAKVLVDGVFVGTSGVDGKLRTRVPASPHVLRIERPGSQPYEERLAFARGEVTRVERTLPPALTTVGFGDDFETGLGRWSGPKTGVTGAGKLGVAGATVPILAAGIVYEDFVLSFNLTLVNGGGAAWVVRAADENDYYLFYLSGPDGRFPNRFLVYVVRGGKLDLDAPAAASARVSSKLAPGEGYYVEVIARGNSIATQITPVSTGVRESLGGFADPNATFASGGFGFRSVAGEAFTVDDCYADPPAN